MGTITATLRANKWQKNARTASYIVDLVFAGSYVAAGDILNLCAIAGIKTSKNRKHWSVWINNSSGYGMSYMRGTDLTNGKVKINTAATTELTATTYPTTLSTPTDLELWAEITCEEL